MAAVGFGWATGQSVRYLRGGGIHYTYNLAVGEGKGVARAHKTKQAGGGGGLATFHTNIAQFLLGFTAF